MRAPVFVLLALLPVLPPVPDGGAGDGAVVTAAVATAHAERVNPPAPPPPPTGLYGMPFAPESLSGCDEMHFYRIQWNLPAVFDGLGWRESNCRNEDRVRTGCCHGYLQLWIGLQLRDHRMAPRLAACNVDSYEDVNSDTPLDKQRQMCAAHELWEVEGMTPWR